MLGREFNPNITGGNTVFKRLTTLAMGCSFAAAMLAGCGGSGGSTAVPVSPAPQGNKTGNVSLTFHLNRTHGTSLRGRKYTSRNTAGIGLSYRVHGSSTAFATDVAGLESPMFASAIAPGFTSNNVTCGSADGSGAYSCSILVPAPVGYDDFQITTWDQAPSSNTFGGTFAASANDLSTNVISNQLIVQNTTNTISYTLNGVVASVALSVSPDSLVSGGSTAQTTTLSVLALDADGNIIIGSDPYVDNAGNPVTIVINKTEDDPANPVGGTAPANGNVQFAASANCAGATQCTVTDPTVQYLTVDYNNYQTNSATFAATATSAAATIPSNPLNAVLKITNTIGGGSIGAAGSPTMNLASITSGAAITSGHYGDGHLYLADAADHQVLQLSTGTPGVSQTYGGYFGNEQFARAAFGPDNAIWVTSPNDGEVAQWSVPASQGLWNTFCTTPGCWDFAPLVSPFGIAAGPDHNMWVTDPVQNEAFIITLPTGNEYGPGAYLFTPVTGFSANAGLGDIASDGTGLWTSETNTQKIAQITTTGVVTEYAVAGASTLGSLTLGPDGNIWVADSGANKVFVISNQSGTVGTVLKTISTTGTPQQIAAGAGAVYVTETTATGNLVGKIALNGTLSEYSNGLPDNTNPLAGIAFGADGNFYMTESTGSNVVYFAP